MWRDRFPFLLLLCLLAPLPAIADPAADFQQHCAECHGPDRLGRMGPALLPENLARLRQPQARQVIADGRQQTQMKGFSDRLSAEQIDGLVKLIYTPLPSVPVWGEADIRASLKTELTADQLPDKPVYQADMMNLFIVVEMGDSHVTVLDGSKFEPIARFPSHFALHGGPKYSPDGRFVYFASRDGWVTKFDLYSLKVVADVRAGINTRNLAISGDGRTLAVANYLPHSLVMLDADTLQPLKIIPAVSRKGISSRVSAVYQAEPRDSFVVALKDVPELWTINWTDSPPPVYQGMVHSYEPGMIEGMAEKGRFPVRRIDLSEPLDDFFFDPSYTHLLGSARDGGHGVVVHLYVGREIAQVPLTGLPHLGSGITWSDERGSFIATPDLKEGKVTVIDRKTWKVVKTIDTLGPGIFLRSHEYTPYAWVDSSFSKAKDSLQIIDKRSLEVVAQVTPEPGKTANHVEFSRDGKFALVSVSEDEGWLVVYDATTLKEVKRLPMRKPMGKYNVFNKITRSGGTSH
jgi:DNA-binding beta-propeller fold protein YncE